MPSEPTLVFLHGVGDGDQGDRWLTRLSESLKRLGYPALESARTIAPKYSHALRGWDERQTVPGLTIKQPARDAARANRREFERRTGAIESRLGRHDPGTGRLGGDAAVAAAIRYPWFAQAHNYLNDAQIRAQVLNVILARIPATGDIVIVGHSLGSVIAADLIRRLPAGVRVIGLVTIGSPLAHGAFDVQKLSEPMKEPPTNLDWWVNFWNSGDLVSAHRGVSSVFPWMIDLRIDTKNVGIAAHAAVSYLGDDSVALAIGFAMFGSLSTEIARVERGLETPLDVTEQYVLLALRYAHLTSAHLDGDQKDRFAGALRLVQSAAVDQIVRRNKAENRPMPSALARLAFDMSDPHVAVPEPRAGGHMSKDDAVPVMTVLATENIIRPFEIVIPKEKRQKAMEDLTAEMGLTSAYGRDVFAAAKEAQDVLTGARNINWIKWGAVGAGAAVIVVATGGLALAAAPGVAGAAVLTSALAAFGPGGMIGGLLTAGTLVTAGGGGIAFGLASPGTTAETVESIVQSRLAATILRKRQGLEPDPSVWGLLAETEIEVRREHERIDEFSDASSPALKELARKIVTIERALEYLRGNGLEPEIQGAGHDDSH